MKIERKKVSVTKTVVKTILTITGIFIVLSFALLYSFYINPAKFGILENVRGIDKSIIIGIGILLYLVIVIAMPIFITHQAIWNNRHLDLAPIEVFEDYIIINSSSNKNNKFYLKDIKKFKGEDDTLDMTLSDNTTTTIRYIKEVTDVETYLNSLLPNRKEGDPHGEKDKTSAQE